MVDVASSGLIQLASAASKSLFPCTHFRAASSIYILLLVSQISLFGIFGHLIIADPMQKSYYKKMAAHFTACSYGLCLNFDPENLVVISFLFQLGAESRQPYDREGLFVLYVRYVNGPWVMYIILFTIRGTYDLRRAMLKALGRDRKQLLPTGPAPRTELQKVDDTILQRVPLVDNWIKENHAKLMRACQSVDLSIVQGVMEKCSGQCCVCYGTAGLRSPCCRQFICSPCFEQWHQNDVRCYVCREDFCQWLEGPLDWNLVQLIVRKDHIDT